jgi:tetratricopeptide (TPR) repeat protein
MIRKELAWAVGGTLGLAFIAAVTYASLAPHSNAPRAAVSGALVGGVHGVASDCRSDAKPCDCSERRASELLLGCFADKAFETASSAGPSCENPGLLGVKAEALAATGQSAGARSAANSLLEKDPKNRFARRALAIVSLSERDFASAEASLGALITEDQRDADSRYYLALLNRERDRYREARQGFLQVLRQNKRHIDARFNLATMTAAIGAKEEAQHHLDELFQITPVGDPRLALAKTAVAQASSAKTQKPASELVIQNRNAPANPPSAAP